MAASQQIEERIVALGQSVEAGLRYFQGPGGQAKVKIGHWGPREVLSTLVWWHQATVEGMESVLAGGKPYRFYASSEEMNARAVGRAAGKGIAQLADTVRQLQSRLVQAAPALPDPNATVLVSGDGSEHSALQRLETMAQHWNERVKALQTLSAA
ncbi:MAG TPA: DinB family protein [Candidatus Tectomicrobia bacterium]